MDSVFVEEQDAGSTAEFVYRQEFNEKKRMEEDIIELEKTGLYGTLDSVRVLYIRLYEQNGGVRPSKEAFYRAYRDLRGKSLEIRDRMIANKDKEQAHHKKMINSLLDQRYASMQENQQLREENLRLMEQIFNEKRARITAEKRVNLAEEEIYRLALNVRKLNGVEE